MDGKILIIMKRTFKFLKLPITREVESFKLKFLKNCFLFEKIKNFMLEINFVSKQLFFLKTSNFLGRKANYS